MAASRTLNRTLNSLEAEEGTDLWGTTHAGHLPHLGLEVHVEPPLSRARVALRAEGRWGWGRDRTRPRALTASFTRLFAGDATPFTGVSAPTSPLSSRPSSAIKQQ